MKKLLAVVLFFGIMVLISRPAMSAEPKMRIAVMDLKGSDLPEKTVKTVSSMIRNDLINIGSFMVVERAQMDAILEEQGLQQTGCTDQTCVVEMGKLLSAKKILMGEISTLGKGLIVTVRIVDVENGVSEFAATEKAESEDMLDRAVNNLAKKLAARIEGRRVDIVSDENRNLTPSPLAGYYGRGLVPGWAQFYSGHYVQGTFFGLAFWGGAVWTAVAILNYYKSKKDYDSLGPGLSQDRYDSAYDKYKKKGETARYSVIGLAAVWGLNLIDVLFFTKPEAEKTAGIFRYGNVYVDLNTHFYKQYNYSSDKRTDLSFTMTF